VSGTTIALQGGTVWSVRQAGWLIVAVAVTTIAIGPPTLLTVFGYPGGPPSGPAAVVFPLALGVLALQLRHSFAIARGERPGGVLLTLLAQAVLVYLPLHWFGWSPWVSLQTTLMASLPLVLRGWRLAAAVAAPLVATDVIAITSADQTTVPYPVPALYEISYWTIRLGLLAAGLYGSARLVRLLGELRETRAELAALAVGRERLRVSRDLHDLLGQSLSAVALKGDLAIRLLRSDPPAARSEIEGLTGLARGAIRGIHAVSRDEHAVSLRTETEGAAALLSAAGIRSRIDVDLPDLTPPLERMLAWVVREGVANALRHSEARTCSITGGRRDGNVLLEIVNDGAPAPAAGGSGLAGLTERARALSGSVAAKRTADGEFRLLVEVPEEA
jgi:two-component system sensor histidine kinase DesK